MKNITIKNIILAVLGTIFVGFGVGMFVKVSVGVDAFSAFQAAVANLLGCKLGTVTALSNAGLLILALLINKKFVGPATVIFIFVSKWPVDFAFANMIVSDNYFINVLLGVISLFVLCLGCELFILSNLGATAYDGVALGIKSKFKRDVKYIYVRYVMDGIFLLTAFILNGPIGIGTILSWALAGIFMKIWEKLLVKLLKLDIKGM